jgi:putative signal transducing protein
VSWHACYSAPSPQAHVVKGFLEQRGVPVLLRAEGPSMYPSAAFGARVHVLVPEDWLPVARKLVDRRRQLRAAPRVVPLRRRVRR